MPAGPEVGPRAADLVGASVPLAAPRRLRLKRSQPRSDLTLTEPTALEEGATELQLLRKEVNQLYEAARIPFEASGRGLRGRVVANVWASQWRTCR